MLELFLVELAGGVGLDGLEVVVRGGEEGEVGRGGGEGGERVAECY